VQALADASERITDLAKELARHCTDKKIRTNLLQVRPQSREKRTDLLQVGVQRQEIWANLLRVIAKSHEIRINLF
jgi:hypothetical protein